MPLNLNPWVGDLLAWHGHERGGVRVPFNGVGGNPLRDAAGSPIVIETALLTRLRALASRIAAGETSPRWVFLVGGPGNGKSEAVQEFLVALDKELDVEGSLLEVLRHEFAPAPLVRWRVDIDAKRFPELPQSFGRLVGRLIVVQDASASDQPLDDASAVLSSFLESLLDLVTSPPPLPVFVCCVNRGLLARALKTARDAEEGSEVAGLVRALVCASALGTDALAEDRRTCWPLRLPEGFPEGVVACWPLDVESLLLPHDDGGPDPSPVDRMFAIAVEADRWERVGRCADCDDSDLCPFRLNAHSIRDTGLRRSLLRLLRRGELATGLRWNFRDSFSLIAELIVGEWTDFGTATHPCMWVHELAAECKRADQASYQVVSPAYKLLSRLYPHALFPTPPGVGLPEATAKTASQRGFETTLSLDDALSEQSQVVPTHYVRTLLAGMTAPELDPALLSPHVAGHPVSRLEDAYSQSVALGNTAWPTEMPMFSAESVFMRCVKAAEGEWDLMSREALQLSEAMRFLRTLASAIAKRSVGTRMAAHANEEYLGSYEAAIRDEAALDNLLDSLRGLLGGDNFCFNALESFGQPRSDSDWLVSLQGTRMPINPVTPAPRGGGSLPAHDLPAIRVRGYAVPLTYDLYVALRLRQDGCAEGSLPASVRASIDRIRHRFAGELCRNAHEFVVRSAEYVVRDRGRVAIVRHGESPRFRPTE